MHKDLIDSYKRVCSSCWSQGEAYEKMVKQPAPRYYISAKQAYQVLSPMVRGDFTRFNRMGPMKQRMYTALFEEVVKLAESPLFFNKSLRFIVQHAVAKPAPEFFISPGRAQHLRRWLKSGIIDNEGRIVQHRLPSYIRTLESHNQRNKEKRQWMSEKISEEQRQTP